MYGKAADRRFLMIIAKYYITFCFSCQRTEASKTQEAYSAVCLLCKKILLCSHALLSNNFYKLIADCSRSAEDCNFACVLGFQIAVLNVLELLAVRKEESLFVLCSVNSVSLWVLSFWQTDVATHLYPLVVFVQL